MTYRNDDLYVRERLYRVGLLLVEHEQFTCVNDAVNQLTKDYRKGYPSDAWIDGLFQAHDEGRLVEVTWDSKTGNYNWLSER